MENNKYKTLKEDLIKASFFYYKKGISIMSDYEFDMKLKQLEHISGWDRHKNSCALSLTQLFSRN